MKSPRESNPVEEKSAAAQSPHVSIVDDDESVREAIKSLLRSVGFGADVFASAEEFLRSDRLKDTTCLILDVRMPGMNGLELQERLASLEYKIPIIFITAHVSDQEARHRALQAGAVDFLRKPFSEETLLEGVYAITEFRGGRV
jgi:FixJ family two-component response regulator